MRHASTSLRAPVAGKDAKQLQAKIAAWRGKIAAIDTLTGESQTAISSETEPDMDDEDDEDGTFIPQKSYWKPILLSLVEMGGRGRRNKVIQAVGVKMKDILTPADRSNYKSGLMRWRKPYGLAGQRNAQAGLSE